MRPPALIRRLNALHARCATVKVTTARARKRARDPDLETVGSSVGSLIYVLNISCPVSAYDVTLEPTKLAILFADEDAIVEAITRALATLWTPTDAAYTSVFREYFGGGGDFLQSFASRSPRLPAATSTPGNEATAATLLSAGGANSPATLSPTPTPTPPSTPGVDPVGAGHVRARAPSPPVDRPPELRARLVSPLQLNRVPQAGQFGSPAGEWEPAMHGASRKRTAATDELPNAKRRKTPEVGNLDRAIVRDQANHENRLPDARAAVDPLHAARPPPPAAPLVIQSNHAASAAAVGGSLRGRVTARTSDPVARPRSTMPLQRRHRQALSLHKVGRPSRSVADGRSTKTVPAATAVESMLEEWTNPVLRAATPAVAEPPRHTVTDSVALTRDMLAAAEVVGQYSTEFVILHMRDPPLLVAVDQHAADERVGLERLLAKVRLLFCCGWIVDPCKCFVLGNFERAFFFFCSLIGS